MASETEKAEVYAMIRSFYEFAHIPLPAIEINEQVASVFGMMLSETTRCSDAFKWVPKPPLGRASISWLAIQFARGMFNHYRAQLSFVCVRGVILKWNGELEFASQGFTNWRLRSWT